jgi:hypothetical protein
MGAMSNNLINIKCRRSRLRIKVSPRVPNSQLSHLKHLDEMAFWPRPTIRQIQHMRNQSIGRNQPKEYSLLNKPKWKRTLIKSFHLIVSHDPNPVNSIDSKGAFRMR